ncbi:hypothetical protein H5J25_07575 [Sphingomonas aliaeris]|uniref:Uncharacterized protein n=1 Tax=Sphingomonas aliaeris TaxID=2759526 RepID=A0A974NX98_9SPHN|nr:class I SAM-dependent methyltransferase [Sphingomonas aliaeris]QQV78487.1 hypothetical protein H5J25_07575 [Sphingomonas aliaeris]
MILGTFVSPDPSLEAISDLATHLGVKINSGYRALPNAQEFKGRNRFFDLIADRSSTIELDCEDQCSAKYYFDLVQTLRDLNGEFGRVVEVGVYMGGASSVIAGCIEHFHFDLDLIDTHLPHLLFAYERIRRLYPESIGRVRLFHGDLPSYVRHVLDERSDKYVIHHDGSHNFEQVVRDMASLSFIQQRLCAIIAQDTHLRGAVKYMSFVDMAMYAVFGLDLKYAPIGTAYAAHDSRTDPNQYEGNYFMPDAPEGFVLPMAVNRFQYPHPTMDMDQFLPPKVILPLAVAA